MAILRNGITGSTIQVRKRCNTNFPINRHYSSRRRLPCHGYRSFSACLRRANARSFDETSVSLVIAIQTQPTRAAPPTAAEAGQRRKQEEKCEGAGNPVTLKQPQAHD